MFTLMNTAIYFLYVLIAVNIGFAVVIYGIKLKNIRKRKMYERFHRRFKEYLIYIQANLDSDEPLREPPVSMNPYEKQALQEKLIDMIESFAGVHRDKLIELCGRLGFIEAHIEKLNGKSYRAKIDAAYHLGCMRVRQAVPALLELLRRHPLDSSLFVVARAIAKCARNVKDVKEMVRIMLAHNTSFPELIADMIEEAPVNQAALFADFIQDDQPGIIRIGLAGLKEYNSPKIAAAVYRLMDSSLEDIQRKAIQIYLKSSAILPRNVVSRLIGHPNADVRLMTVQALSELNNTFYLPELQKGLEDRDQRVVYASAMSLIRNGEEGISAFCRAARDDRDRSGDTFLQDIIEEELRLLSTKLHALDQLKLYNSLLYAYEKTFGKNKHLYRVV
ncbi:HEAT repeat domain-containing protein [Paenibacillus thermotolerans]|uniref:HEAT repeat domain-containing protein n=1 Tax=Paenibacillus thermotolerans TaxID=3027807 RepID=UPI002367E462|nr:MULTISPECIES: HEAT repeat domain-containing protein [unclassified Paenibacillus]